MRLNKSGQNEIVGLVIIVLLVTVIGVVFLSLSIGRGDSTSEKSIEFTNFLQASMYHTTDCYLDFAPRYREMQDLIKDCYDNEKCKDGRLACDVLKELYPEIIKQSLDIHPDSKNKAYNLSIYYKNLNSGSQTLNKEILKFGDGVFANCTSKPSASQAVYASDFDSGVINVELKVCKG
jgi:hypothetical protein